MRLLFGLIGLLLALLVVAWLVKTQLGADVTGHDGSKDSRAGAQSASQALSQFQKSLNKALKTRPASVPE